MCYKFFLSHRTSAVEKRIISCVFWSSLLPPPFTSSVLPSFLPWDVPALVLAKASLGYQSEETSSMSVTDSAFNRAPLLPPQHTPREEHASVCAREALQRGICTANV